MNIEWKSRHVQEMLPAYIVVLSTDSLFEAAASGYLSPTEKVRVEAELSYRAKRERGRRVLGVS